MKGLIFPLVAITLLASCAGQQPREQSGMRQADTQQLPVVVPDTSAASMPVVPMDTGKSDMPVVRPPDSIQPK